jgi:hypothetical protein
MDNLSPHKLVEFRALALASCVLPTNERNQFIDGLQGEYKNSFKRVLQTVPERLVDLAKMLDFKQFQLLLSEFLDGISDNAQTTEKLRIPEFLDETRKSSTITSATRALIDSMISDFEEDNNHV